jgi:hypothetical protein
VGIQSLIQSDCVAGSIHNLDALVQDGSSILHYTRDAASGNWSGPIDTVSTNADAPASLMLGEHIGGDGHRELEALVLEGSNLNSYIRDDTGWHQTGTVTTTATDTGTMALTDIALPSGYHETDALVLEGTNLNSYFEDDTGWHFATTVSTTASGPASLILSDRIGVGGHKQLQALALDGSNLHSYIRDDSGWHLEATITTAATGPASMMLSDYDFFGTGFRDVEVLVPEGTNLKHYFGQEGQSWMGTRAVTATASGPASFIMGDAIGTDGHRVFEALATTANGVHAYVRVTNPIWHRTRFNETNLIVWVNPAGGNWNVPGNWDLNRVPVATDDVVIDLGGSYGRPGRRPQRLRLHAGRRSERHFRRRRPHLYGHEHRQLDGRGDLVRQPDHPRRQHPDRERFGGSRHEFSEPG